MPQGIMGPHGGRTVSTLQLDAVRYALEQLSDENWNHIFDRQWSDFERLKSAGLDFVHDTDVAEYYACIKDVMDGKEEAL
jgi:hypothetical protein